MRNLARIFSLPASLLLLITSTPWPSAAEPQWPHNLPADSKYFPEDEVHVKRGLQAMERLAAQQAPIGARKMSGDKNEMFFLEYWQFEDLNDAAGSATSPRDRILKRSQPEDYANGTLENDLLPPLLLHSDNLGRHNWQSHLRFNPRSNLIPRDFQCPSGTNNCSSISRPYSCCATDETCVVVSDNLDAGMGDVGCCKNGSTCNGQVAECDTSQGYQSCPGSENGGCCIPNYSCAGVGCKKLLESI
jgi:hypothetical protein